jgi:zinc protease
VQSVSATQSSRELAGTLQVTAQAREGVTLAQMEAAVLEEVVRLAKQGPTEEELARARNRAEARSIYALQTLLGKADRINRYLTFRGQPDLFAEDLDRVRRVTAADVRRTAQTYLTRPKVVLSTVPKGHRELAARESGARP